MIIRVGSRRVRGQWRVDVAVAAGDSVEQVKQAQASVARELADATRERHPESNGRLHDSIHAAAARVRALYPSADVRIEMPGARSGSTRSYAAKASGDRPLVSLTIAQATKDALAELATRSGRSRGAIVDDAVRTIWARYERGEWPTEDEAD